MGTSYLTRTVAVIREQRVEDRRELLQQLLDQAIHDAGNPGCLVHVWVFWGGGDGAYTLRVILDGR